MVADIMAYPITPASMKERVAAALEALLINDHALLERDVAERAICSRIALYLEGHFPSLAVDVEYNRRGIDPKRLLGIEECGGNRAALVYPDIIVHRRGDDQENLLVVEVKKSTNATSRDCDRAKLAGFVEELGYRYAVLVDLPTGARSGEPPTFEWIADGP